MHIEDGRLVNQNLTRSSYIGFGISIRTTLVSTIGQCSPRLRPNLRNLNPQLRGKGDRVAFHLRIGKGNDVV